MPENQNLGMDSIAENIKMQMSRAGQPQVVKTEVEEPEQPFDWGTMGLLLAMVLGKAFKPTDANASQAGMIGEVSEPTGGAFAGSPGVLGVQAAPAASANPLMALGGSQTGGKALTQEEIMQLFMMGQQG